MTESVRLLPACARVSENRAVTVVVGRFEPLVGYGLAHVLDEDPGVCVLASDLESVALEGAVARWAPHVTVLDEVSDSFVREHVRSILPRTGVLSLAHRPSREYGMRLLRSGVTCLARNASASDIRAALRLTARGGRAFVSPGGDWVRRRFPSDVRLLSERQVEVLALLSEGRSNAEIANALRISVETTRTHVATILHKLDVGSRRELMGMPVRGLSLAMS